MVYGHSLNVSVCVHALDTPKLVVWCSSCGSFTVEQARNTFSHLPRQSAVRGIGAAAAAGKPRLLPGGGNTD
eukprot:2965893-Prorocentrum_lima.AAC.1